MKKITILGDGQVWDVRGVDPQHPARIFEDVFCGRVLEEKARRKGQIFSRYLEKGKTDITGMSVTLALRDSKNKKAQQAALTILQEVAQDAARGIAALTRGEAHKPGWTKDEVSLWKNLTGLVIGGGVSAGRTGDIIVKEIKNYLTQHNLSDIAVYKARFFGKEAGFLGAAVQVMDVAWEQGNSRKLSRIAVLGLDVGREKIGVGILVFTLRSCGIITQIRQKWLYRYAVRTVKIGSKIKDFRQQRKLGKLLRGQIIEQIASLITRALRYLEKKKIPYAIHIGLAVPGKTNAAGYIIDSTDYLPFFTQRDGFHFSRAVEEAVKSKTGVRMRVHIINDGIAAGLANIRMGLPSLGEGKYAFLGPGSGLGGCLCKVEEVR